jgi:hypothetical protein
VKKTALTYLPLCLILMAAALSISSAQQPPPQQSPADVAGKWTIYSKGPDGTTSTKYIELEQEGTALKGHFKGPNQSGGLEGTIEERHIVFRTKTRYVLTFRGRVDGNRVNGVIEGTAISGTFHDRKGTGEWQAVRASN